MIFAGALAPGLFLQPIASSQAIANDPVGRLAARNTNSVAGPNAGTDAALRTRVAGLARGSPDDSKLSAQFAELVSRDLPPPHRAGRVCSMAIDDTTSMSASRYAHQRPGQERTRHFAAPRSSDSRATACVLPESSFSDAA